VGRAAGDRLAANSGSRRLGGAWWRVEAGVERLQIALGDSEDTPRHGVQPVRAAAFDAGRWREFLVGLPTPDGRRAALIESAASQDAGVGRPYCLAQPPLV